MSPAYAQLVTPNDAGLRYGHVHLNVSDVEVHKQLWVEHFGGVAVLGDRVRLHGLVVALSAREPTGGSQGSGMDHFGFHVRNMEKFLAKWRAAGLPVMSEFTGTLVAPLVGVVDTRVGIPASAVVKFQVVVLVIPVNGVPPAVLRAPGSMLT